jgi:transaldolase/glucose-6-phosphate isomerase
MDAFERDPSAVDAPVSGDDDDTIRSALASIAPGGYAAVLAFLPMTAENDAALQRFRTRVRDASRAGTLVGFGPRYLHSTGQAFKGGPSGGVFVQITREPRVDVEIPGRRATFGTVIAAQAAGDRQVLRERGRRVAHLHLRARDDLESRLAALR